MEICYDQAQFDRYVAEAFVVADGQPVLIDRFLEDATALTRTWRVRHAFGTHVIRSMNWVIAVNLLVWLYPAFSLILLLKSYVLKSFWLPLMLELTVHAFEFI